MNHGHIEQYVSGRMSESEAQAFEQYCVANPEFARLVEYEQRLKAGIRQVASGSTAEFVRSEQPVGWKIAAGLGAIVALAAVLYAWRGMSPRATQPVMAAVATQAERGGPSMRLALVRGAESMPALQPGRVRVEIVGLFDPVNDYTVALDRLEEQKNVHTLATLYSQRAASPMTLEVMIDSDRLEPGAYTLRVRKQASDEEPLDFGFLKN